jgi:acetyl esterase/lipase
MKSSDPSPNDPTPNPIVAKPRGKPGRVIEYLIATLLVLGLTAPAQVTPVQADDTTQVIPFQLPFSAFASNAARQKFVERARAELPATQDVASLRKFYNSYNERLAHRMREVFAVELRHETWDGIPVLLARPAAAGNVENRRKVLINLHGGAFMWGSGFGLEVEAIPIAATTGIVVVSVDYSLAPEHPFPAAVQDVLTVYRHLLKTYAPLNIGIYGSSAGGLLASETVAELMEEHLPIPGALGTFYGSALSFDGDSIYTSPVSVNEPALKQSGPDMRSNPYFRGAELESPLLFPANSPVVLRHFPPTLLLAATRDQAFSSAVESELALHRAGVPTEMRIWDGMWHAFFVDPDIPESREAYAVAAAFFRTHLGHKAAKE